MHCTDFAPGPWALALRWELHAHSCPELPTLPTVSILLPVHLFAHLTIYSVDRYLRSAWACLSLTILLPFHIPTLLAFEYPYRTYNTHPVVVPVSCVTSAETRWPSAAHYAHHVWRFAEESPGASGTFIIPILQDTTMLCAADGNGIEFASAVCFWECSGDDEGGQHPARGQLCTDVSWRPSQLYRTASATSPFCSCK